MSDFSVKVSVSRNGDVMAAYFKVKAGKHHETRTVVDGYLMADYDEFGEILGIEMIGQCLPEDVEQIDAPEAVKHFVLKAMPQGLVRFKEVA